MTLKAKESKKTLPNGSSIQDKLPPVRITKRKIHLFSQNLIRALRTMPIIKRAGLDSEN
jgi:hypothetical protein